MTQLRTPLTRPVAPPRTLRRTALGGGLLWLCLAALSAFGTTSAWAGAPDATHFLKDRHAKVEKILKRNDSKARASALTAELSHLLDYQELSKRALRDHWDTLDAAKQAEFSALLTQLVERSYQQNLESTLEFKVSYSPAQKRGDEVMVQTVARSTKNRRAPEVMIDYALIPAGANAASWRVCDIVTDGVSLVANYRSQFNRIIKKHGFAGLIERMKKKLAQG